MLLREDQRIDLLISHSWDHTFNADVILIAADAHPSSKYPSPKRCSKAKIARWSDSLPFTVSVRWLNVLEFSDEECDLQTVVHNDCHSSCRPYHKPSQKQHRQNSQGASSEGTENLIRSSHTPGSHTLTSPETGFVWKTRRKETSGNESTLQGRTALPKLQTKLRRFLCWPLGSHWFSQEVGQLFRGVYFHHSQLSLTHLILQP